MSSHASAEGIKFDICCAARALFRAGLSVGVAGHLSVAIGENRMLMIVLVPPLEAFDRPTSAPSIFRAKCWSMTRRLIHT